MAGRDTGIQYLRTYWYNASDLGALGFVTFQSALAHYDRISPDFVRSIGDIAASIEQPKVKAAFNAVAREYKTNYPPVGAFFDSLAAHVRTISGNDVREILSDTASDIGSAVAWSFGGVAVLALIGGAIYLGVTGGALKGALASVGKAAKAKGRPKLAGLAPRRA